MLSPLAHAGRPVQPHDLWASWNLDVPLLAALSLAVWLYARGRGPATGRLRAWCFAGGVAALLLALVSPLEAMAGVLASAHMVQHLLLVLVAAPLLARSAPGGALLRGCPVGARRALTGLRRRLPGDRRHPALWHHAPTAWLLHVAALWTWHAAVLYEAALAYEVVHVGAHVVLLATALLFWRVVVGRGAWPRLRVRERTDRSEAAPTSVLSPGAGILLLFTAAMASVFLSVLLTFSEGPWYPSYATTTLSWGLTPLADQRLAGVIMWIPAGLVYVGTALALLVAWLRTVDA